MTSSTRDSTLFFCRIAFAEGLASSRRSCYLLENNDAHIHSGPRSRTDVTVTGVVAYLTGCAAGQVAELPLEFTVRESETGEVWAR